MKALQVDRKVTRFAAARGRRLDLAGRGGRVGPLELTDVDPPELPGPGWHRSCPGWRGSAAATCRRSTAPRAATSSDRQLPVHPRPRGRGRARRRHAGRARAGARLRHPRLRPPSAIVRRRRPRRLRTARLRTPRARHPDRVLLLHRRRLGLVDGRPRDPAARGAGDVPDDGAVLVEPPAGGIHAALRAGCTGRRDASSCSAPARSGCSPSPGSRHLTPVERIVVGARYPAPASPRPRARRRRTSSSRRARPRRALDDRLPWSYGDQLTGGAHAAIDCVGDERLARQSLRHRPAARAGRGDRHARPSRPRPHRACGTARPSSSAPTPTAPSTCPTTVSRRGAHVRPRHAPGRRPPPRPPGSAPRTASPTTSTPSPTPPPPGRRGAVKIAFDLRSGDGEDPVAQPTLGRTDAPPRFRPRRRPLDAAHARSGAARASASRSCRPTAAASSTRPSRSPRSTTSTARSATRCSTRSTRTRCRRCCSRA